MIEIKTKNGCLYAYANNAILKCNVCEFKKAKDMRIFDLYYNSEVVEVKERED